ncbi:MAG: hypothetical protein RIS47_958 [Bacteroidota bacterium]|jgi:uncharacterized protein (TIGR04222 family)
MLSQLFSHLAQIPGPEFLKYYFIFGVIVLSTARFLAKRDPTSANESIEPTKLSPLELATLRQGSKGAILLSILSLWQQKLLLITGEGKKAYLDRTDKQATNLNLIESVLWKLVEAPFAYRKLFQKPQFELLEKAIEPVTTKLEDLRLIPDTLLRTRHKHIRLIARLLLVLVGLSKTYLGLTHNHPVGFLLVMVLGFYIASEFLLSYHTLRHTQLGRKLLKDSSVRFNWLRTEPYKASLAVDENLLYGVAVFGLSSFALTELGASLSDTTQLANSTYINSASCAGCATSDGISSGGYSDGDSGSSDGGCSDGGGSGCGGCGD